MFEGRQVMLGKKWFRIFPVLFCWKLPLFRKRLEAFDHFEMALAFLPLQFIQSDTSFMHNLNAVQYKEHISSLLRDGFKDFGVFPFVPDVIRQTLPGTSRAPATPASEETFLRLVESYCLQIGTEQRIEGGSAAEGAAGVHQSAACWMWGNLPLMLTIPFSSAENCLSLAIFRWKRRSRRGGSHYESSAARVCRFRFHGMNDKNDQQKPFFSTFAIFSRASYATYSRLICDFF